MSVKFCTLHPLKFLMSILSFMEVSAVNAIPFLGAQVKFLLIFPTFFSALDKIRYWQYPRAVIGIATRYGYTVLGSNLGERGGHIFRTRPHRPWVHPAFYTKDTRSSQGIKWPERSVDYPLHLAPGLKNEQSYTSTTRLGLHCLFQA
jgi:hypothetical protein